MNFRPLHDRVVIRRVNAEEKTTGGIIIPDTAQEKPMEGKWRARCSPSALAPATNKASLVSSM